MASSEGAAKVAIAYFQPNKVPLAVAFMVMEKLTSRRVVGMKKLYN
jgi:hypothetical protein